MMADQVGPRCEGRSFQVLFSYYIDINIYIIANRTAEITERSFMVSAREQMRFQEKMSSSAHQREVKDLQAAGLNPVLSAGGSGASSPSGAMDYSGGGSGGVNWTPAQLNQLVQGTAKSVSNAVDNVSDKFADIMKNWGNITPKDEGEVLNMLSQNDKNGMPMYYQDESGRIHQNTYKVADKNTFKVLSAISNAAAAAFSGGLNPALRVALGGRVLGSNASYDAFNKNSMYETSAKHRYEYSNLPWWKKVLFQAYKGTRVGHHDDLEKIFEMIKYM